jgi:hypothetical protein
MSFSSEKTYTNYNNNQSISEHLPKINLLSIFKPNTNEFSVEGVVYSNDWQPESKLNNELLEMNNIKTNADYRKLMTGNSQGVIIENNNLYKKSINQS